MAPVSFGEGREEQLHKLFSRGQQNLLLMLLLHLFSQSQLLKKLLKQLVHLLKKLLHQLLQNKVLLPKLKKLPPPKLKKLPLPKLYKLVCLQLLRP